MLKSHFHLMRFNRPIPILLLLWPLYIAMSVSGQGSFDLKILVIFTLGAIVMRSAGCVANDLADRHIDLHVKRTQFRPLTIQAISVRAASILLGFLLILALILVLQLSWAVFFWSWIALGLALFYPLTKRFFVLPQLVLGLAYNFGVLMVFVAVQQPLSFLALGLYFGCVSWTLAYDTFYALCDKKDDQRLGIHSSALWFGSYVYQAIAFLQALSLSLFLWIGILLKAGWIFYSLLLAVIIVFGWQYTLSAHRGQHLQAFLINHWVGLFLFIATESIFV